MQYCCTYCKLEYLWGYFEHTLQLLVASVTVSKEYPQRYSKLAAATVVVHYMRPTEPVGQIWMCICYGQMDVSFIFRHTSNKICATLAHHTLALVIGCNFSLTTILILCGLLILQCAWFMTTPSRQTWLPHAYYFEQEIAIFIGRTLIWILTIPHKYLLSNQEIWLVSLGWRAWL